MRRADFRFIICCLLPLALSGQPGGQTAGFAHFISSSGAKLYDGDREFRFISVNIPNLLCIEDNLAFTECNPWRLPDKFEIEDALKTARLLGGTVVRTYVITVRRKTEGDDVPRHVQSPGKFSEEAFLAMDQVLASANEIGVRLLIPLVDNWRWMGGRPQYAGFRAKDGAAFWTDAQLKEDFKVTIRYVLNRRNTITGQLYSEDKTILAWELGNEIWRASPEWVAEMAAFVKSIDCNHLLNDGLQFFAVRDEIIDDPNIDILSTHHYEKNPQDMLAHILNTAAKIAGRKPYYIGEFGFIPTPAMEEVLNTVIEDRNISGALLWSLRFHNRAGGFYWHSEPSGYNFYKAYHFPGFQSGKSYDEKNALSLMARKAYEIRELPLPETTMPAAPCLLPIEDVAAVSWQGSAGAAGYDVERSADINGPWETVAAMISDAIYANEPLFEDVSAQPGESYYYRVFARNAAGKSSASNVIGPVRVDHHTLVDHLMGTAHMQAIRGKFSLETGTPRLFKEDFHRLAVQRGSEVIYSLAGPVESFKVYQFTRKQNRFVIVSVSEDGEEYRKINYSRQYYDVLNKDYDFWHPCMLASESVPDNIHYLKLAYLHKAQIGKVEIRYGD